MTEDEAKTKWCPHARELGDGAVSYNRDYNGKATRARCLGSGCMAWQWIDRMTATDDEYEFKSVRIGGFCGLTGHL